MDSMSAMTGFSGPGVPVFADGSVEPLVNKMRSVVVPPALLETLQDRAQAARRARRKAVKAAAAAAPAGEGAAKKAKINAGQRLIQRATMGWTLAEQAIYNDLGYNGYLEYQLDPDSIDDFGLEDAINEAFPTISMTAAELYNNYRDDPGAPIFQLILATMFRGIYSPRGLYERMVHFWSDHFTVHLLSDLGYLLKPTDDRDVIRANALGTFPELLSASAHSPAMLVYLTNDSNVAGHPNENYARELMELHTMGVDNGYTQQDVIEVARCFTGWTAARPGSINTGEFRFNEIDHDDGEKIVLGNVIPAGGGQEDGERVLEILADRPETRKFIARKMLRYLWRYEPKQKAVNAVAAEYKRTGGDIKAMLRVALKKSRVKASRAKLKRPFHLQTSTLRALFADVDNVGYLVNRLFLAGHIPFNWETPDGYPDDRAFWSGFILPRWNFATTFLAKNSRAGIKIDVPFLRASWPVNRIVNSMDDYLLNGTMSKATRDALTDFLGAKKVTKKRIKDAVGLAVGSPEFQDY